MHMPDISFAVLDLGLRGCLEESLLAVFQAARPGPAPDPAFDEVLICCAAGGIDGRGRGRAPTEEWRREIPREWRDRVRIMEMQPGASHGAARSLALQQSRGRYVLLIDSDVVIRPEVPGLLQRALQERGSAVAAAPRLLMENGRPRRSSRGFPRLCAPVATVRRACAGVVFALRLHDAVSRLRGDPVTRGGQVRGDTSTRRVAVPLGCCMLLRRERAAEVGAFDEAYAFHFDVADWSWRARRMGYTAHLVRGADAFRIPPQRAGMLPAEVVVAHEASVCRLVRSNRGRAYYSIFTGVRLARALTKAAVARLLGAVALGRSKRCAHEMQVMDALVRWHVSGRGVPVCPPELEYTTRWEGLG